MESFPGLYKECIFKAVRSGGKGGQNVNKVSTKVELYFSIADSHALDENKKSVLQNKLHHLLNEEGKLRIVCDEERSQKRNKDKAYEKLEQLFAKALTPRKKRIKTRTPYSVKQKRLKTKKIKSEIKSMRKKPGLE